MSQASFPEELRPLLGLTRQLARDGWRDLSDDEKLVVDQAILFLLQQQSRPPSRPSRALWWMLPLVLATAALAFYLGATRESDAIYDPNAKIEFLLDVEPSQLRVVNQNLVFGAGTIGLVIELRDDDDPQSVRQLHLYLADGSVDARDPENVKIVMRYSTPILGQEPTASARGARRSEFSSWRLDSAIVEFPKLLELPNSCDSVRRIDFELQLGLGRPPWLKHTLLRAAGDYSCRTDDTSTPDFVGHEDLVRFNLQSQRWIPIR